MSWFLVWFFKKILVSFGAKLQWPGHRSSWPVQHQQEKILALWYSVFKTWLQIVTPSLHFQSMVTPSTMLLTSDILAPKWHQLQVTSNGASAFWKLERLLKGSQLSSSAKVKLSFTTCVTVFLVFCLFVCLLFVVFVLFFCYFVFCVCFVLFYVFVFCFVFCFVLFFCFLYGCEPRVLSLDVESKIKAFAISCYRIMLWIKRQDCISNFHWLFIPWPTQPLVYYVRKRQLGSLGHILRLPEA